MLYIVGLGLNEKSLTIEGKEAVKKCNHIYLEGYTVDFPYDPTKLTDVLGKKFEILNRNGVESDKLVNEGKKEDVCLLVYGSPLFATTHTTLIEDCNINKVKIKIIHNSSVLDALGETGLQLYKFGKISSMPAWKKSYTPDSFLDYVIENKKIGAHSLILVDIGLSFNDAIQQLEKSIKNKKINFEDIVVCCSLGTEKSKIFFGKLGEIKSKKITSPYCFIIPGKMHFTEERILLNYKV